jgi:(1->4)-alpha-D-glucan 1-alpha-D-glucosylmutase
VLHEGLGSDVNRLASLFVDICENHRDRRDYTRAEIRRALREVAACFPVYRTYVVPATKQITDEDRNRIGEAVARAKQSRQDLDAGLFDFIADVLTLKVTGELEGEFTQRFQQFTSPVMAKGVEDTAFYSFNRMIGLNEVGNDPGRVGVDRKRVPPVLREDAGHASSYHDDPVDPRHQARRRRARPAGDDHGNSPGVEGSLRRWSRRNAAFRTGEFPDRNTEYFLYQTLVGAWPITQERLLAYMEKAMREAKVQTNWTQPNKDFEDALRGFIERMLSSAAFLWRTSRVLFDECWMRDARIASPNRCSR